MTDLCWERCCRYRLPVHRPAVSASRWRRDARSSCATSASAACFRWRVGHRRPGCSLTQCCHLHTGRATAPQRPSDPASAACLLLCVTIGRHRGRRHTATPSRHPKATQRASCRCTSCFQLLGTTLQPAAPARTMPPQTMTRSASAFDTDTVVRLWGTLALHRIKQPPCLCCRLHTTSALWPEARRGHMTGLEPVPAPSLKSSFTPQRMRSRTSLPASCTWWLGKPSQTCSQTYVPTLPMHAWLRPARHDPRPSSLPVIPCS